LRVLILAAGSGTRWGNYRDIPKHLVEVEGEVLLERTCKQFLRHTDDVVVVGPDERYLVEGTRLYIPDSSKNRELDKFASSMSEWDSFGVTVLVYGDVYFTDEAVQTIVSDHGYWKYFCRSDASSLTGKTAKEIFAIAFDSKSLETIKKAVTKLLPLNGVTGGWTLFRELTLGTPLTHPKDVRMFGCGRHVEIDDWTEDFDYPADLEAWEQARKSLAV
jgi:CTP:phosphocholine cytidylyltransferase-like protein